MKTQHILLVIALNEMIDLYNAKTPDLNFTEVRDFQNFIESQGINIQEVNDFINNKK